MTPYASPQPTRDDLKRRAMELLGSSGHAAPDGFSSQSATNLIDARLRQLLGGKPDLSNPTALRDALLSNYEVTEFEGSTLAQRKQRTQVTILNDLSLLSGAQAAMYKLALSTLSNVTPLLRSLRPLDPAADQDACDSIRLLIEQRLEDLLAELGNQDGPNEQAVVAALHDLLGDSQKNATQLGGHLLTVESRYHLHEEYAHSQADFEQLTSFRNLVSQLHGLARSWQEYLSHQNQPGLMGSRYTAFRRHLPLIADAVQDVRQALNNAGMTYPYQQVFALRFVEDKVRVPKLPLQRGEQPEGVIETIPQTQELFLAQLLEIIDDWCQLSGPRMMQQSGRDGLRTFLENLLRQRVLVYAAQPKSPALQLLGAHQKAYRNAAVRTAMEELAHRLDEACDAAMQVIPSSPPRITSLPVSPVAQQSDLLRVEIIGEHFDRQAKLEFLDASRVPMQIDIELKWESAQRLIADVSPIELESAHMMRVIHPDGQQAIFPWRIESTGVLATLDKVLEEIAELKAQLHDLRNSESAT